MISQGPLETCGQFLRECPRSLPSIIEIRGDTFMSQAELTANGLHSMVGGHG